MRNLKPIYVSLGLSAMLWSCAAHAGAPPDETNFVCVDETSANVIAKASVEDILNGSPDEAAAPYINVRCFFLPRSVAIHVVKLCRTFAKFSKVQVVAFNEADAVVDPSRLFYAIKRLAIYEGAI